MKLTTSVPNASSLDLKLNLDHPKLIFSNKVKSSHITSCFDAIRFLF